MKRLIINADDFGFTHDVNAGIVHAHLHGILTSTTLMANGAAFDDAVRLAQTTPSLGVGCHLVLVQGLSILTGRLLPDKPRDVALAVMLGRLDPYSELRAQIEKIIAAGIRPTHLDSHKHTHVIPQVFNAVARLAAEFAIPWVRVPVSTGRSLYAASLRKRGIKTTDAFIGFRLTGHLNEENMLAALRTLPEGTTEFMCHPGFLGDELRHAPTRLKESRATELQALTSPKVRELIESQRILLQHF